MSYFTKATLFVQSSGVLYMRNHWKDFIIGLSRDKDRSRTERNMNDKLKRKKIPTELAITKPSFRTP